MTTRSFEEAPQPGTGSAPRIELDGELVASDGLTITGSDVAVFDLTINQFGGGLAAGILVDGGDDAVIQGNYIGTDVDGEAGFTGGNTRGVLLQNGATGALIGGQPFQQGNVISNNAVAGITISDVSPTQAVVQGNKIGTDPTGTLAVANGKIPASNSKLPRTPSAISTMPPPTFRTSSPSTGSTAVSPSSQARTTSSRATAFSITPGSGSTSGPGSPPTALRPTIPRRIQTEAPTGSRTTR